MGTVVRVENLSKQYRLGDVGTGSMKDDFKRFRYRLMGKEDPFLQVGEVNDRTKKSSSDYVWALKDINFEIEQGDVVGIIGRNGAGKSTLLKILSRTTAPTTGSVKVKGRIASLLEVGTGFHGELSGRENIYLNGAIMGLRKWEIDKKLDEIIDFAGVEKYLDTPVKRYSSGMYVRLAFAVAAHLESDILIVDEVLAVGDAEFQKRCLGKMKHYSENQGRTVLFVSHQISSVTQLCSKSILLANGAIQYKGEVSEVVDKYLKFDRDMNENTFVNTNPKKSDIFKIEILNNNENINVFSWDDHIQIKFYIQLEIKYKNAVLGFRVMDRQQRNVFSDQIELSNFTGDGEKMTLLAIIPNKVLVPNLYYLYVALHIPNVEYISIVDNLLSFEIEETGSILSQYNSVDYGCVFIKCFWSSL